MGTKDSSTAGGGSSRSLLMDVGSPYELARFLNPGCRPPPAPSQQVSKKSRQFGVAFMDPHPHLPKCERELGTTDT